MDEKLFTKIYRILDEGGKLRIINRKGQELDITLDYKTAVKLLIEVEESQLNKIKELENNNKQIMQEVVQLKNQLNKLQEIKNIRDNYIIRKKLYEESDEGKLVKRLMNKNIKDVNAAIKNYDENSAQRLIEKEYDQELYKTIKEQISEDYNKSKLDSITNYYNKKFK